MVTRKPVISAGGSADLPPLEQVADGVPVPFHSGDVIA
jgi:hypothetical protein